VRTRPDDTTLDDELEDEQEKAGRKNADALSPAHKRRRRTRVSKTKAIQVCRSRETFTQSKKTQRVWLASTQQSKHGKRDEDYVEKEKRNMTAHRTREMT
jgi:hypothetical protein